MRSLLLQLLSVLCFYGILFSTGNRPAYFVPNSSAIKKVTKIAESQELVVKKEEKKQASTPSKNSSFSVFPKAANLLAMATIKQEKANAIKAPAPKVPAPIERTLQNNATPNPTNQFQIAAETSLREYPEQTADVLKRIGEGEQVEIIENSKKYWWKVNYAGRVGWVKRHLLIRA